MTVPLRFEGSRRLTGPNLYFVECGAVLEALPPFSLEDLEAWAVRLRTMRDRLGWPDGPVVVRRHPAGAILACAAPEDQLFTATELNEWAWQAGASFEAGSDLPHAPGHPALGDAAQALATLQALSRAEAQPRLMQLLSSAAERGIPAFLDDETLSLGAALRGRSWPRSSLPDPGEVPWPALGSVPIALVTGSNGKTTTVRLVAAMGTAAGWRMGYTCTDGVSIGDDLRCSGDYSGPAGARLVLRDPMVEGAVLETARGGILRRGLAMCEAQAAIVTNVSADHFGEYGIHDLEDLADTKLVVTRVLAPGGGMLVLNAEDPVLLRRGEQWDGTLGWFALAGDHPRLVAHRVAGGATCGVQGQRLLLHAANVAHDLGSLEELPLAAGGAARYNIANMAGAALLAWGLGIPVAAIREVLGRFGSHRRDNPGRLERWNFPELTLIMDYAHNPEGLEGLLAVAETLRSTGRLGLVLGQAGNREDGSIRALARRAAAARPAFVVVKEMESYIRGRRPGEVPRILSEELIRAGIPPAHQSMRNSELLAARELLGWAQPGDVLVLPIHDLQARLAVATLLDQLVDSGWSPGTDLPS